MAVVPVLPAVVAGAPYPSSSLSAFEAVAAFLLAPPLAELEHTTGTSIPNATFTAVPWNIEVYDLPTANKGHSTSVNPSRYTVVYPGVYEMEASPAFTNNLTGVRICDLRVNGTAINGSRGQIGGNAGSGFPAIIPPRIRKQYFNIGDYVEAFVYQDSGAPLTLYNVADIGAGSFSIKWVSN